MKPKGYKVKPVAPKIDSKGNAIISSISQGYEWLKGLKKMLRERAKAEKFPITIENRPKQDQYLRYAISLLDERDYHGQQAQVLLEKNLLMAKLQGYSIEFIAKMSGCDVKTARKWEQSAIDRVKDAIAKKRKKGVAILGGQMGPGRLSSLP